MLTTLLSYHDRLAWVPRYTHHYILWLSRTDWTNYVISLLCFIIL